MPVQPMHKEPEEMEMEADSAAEVNGEEEDTEEEQSGSQSESEEESSEMDDEDCERRRIECLDEMSDLEKQFTDLKEKLFKERLSQVKAKLEEVIEGKAAEYLEPLAVLQNNMKIRTEVADTVEGTSHSKEQPSLKKAKKSRLNSSAVQPPLDISPEKFTEFCFFLGLVKTEKHLYSAKCEDGRLYYEGESFIKGQNIILQVKDEMPSQATITAVSTAEVWLRREDGSKTKLYVSQLQKGKYTIRKV
ncbi:breast cancer metastasis-suppressor 1-like protein [Protopterus annectens]|uniref:breast cancer metastasis-suppressor 1-like protein n=1 Tax=Protopterus annectens TaxID=7888 RepID=UPI001CFBF5B3|nr:breast cancer metastasis-suppressor 1-like protein [Protopterus annectens]